jgi:glutamine synthetase
MSKALTAFGNTIPTSYLRLVPDQEAPTSICWGDRNRSVLVRVPLGWIGATNMIRDANPVDDFDISTFPAKQSIEIRSPDGSADIYKLFAGLVIAVEHGLEMKDSLKMAEDLYVDYNIFREGDNSKKKKFESLPSSCWESADCLIEKRHLLEKDGVFPPGLIDSVASRLRAYNDNDLSRRLFNKHDEIRKLVEQYLHCS